jgi:hypothetical protein
MNSKSVFLFSFLATASIATQAGVHIETVRVDVKTGKEESGQSMWIQNGMARMESSGARSSLTIFKNDVIHSLDTKNKTYRVMDKETLDQAAGMMDDAMAKMRARMDSMTPEQRAMVENMMKQRGGAMGAAGPQKQVVYDAQPTGGIDTVNGKSCKLWIVTRDGAPNQQLCVAPPNSMPGADEVIAMSKKMAALFEKLSERMGGAISNEFQQSTATLAKINGYPVMSRRYVDGALAPEKFIVKSWAQESIDAAKFEIPADYTKQDLPMRAK